MTVLPELGNNLPTIAGVVGETNTILISLLDIELIKRLLPTIGANGNWWVNGEDTSISALADSSKIMRLSSLSARLWLLVASLLML